MELESSSKLKKFKPLIIIAVIIAVLVAMYFTAVYSNIGFIKDLRELYIETAMSTFTHKWLATAFIPESVINEVMDKANAGFDKNLEYESVRLWTKEENVIIKEAPDKPSKVTKQSSDNDETVSEYNWQEHIRSDKKKEFKSTFDEIDFDTFNWDLFSGDIESLQLTNLSDYNIKTTSGDTVWGIDNVNKILILDVAGDKYKGKLAIVKDSSMVKIGVSQLDWRGQTVGELCDAYNAVLGINANGFGDAEGKGDGSIPVGLIISNGEVLHDRETTSYYKVCGFDYDDNFILGNSYKDSEFRDAAQFFPSLIANGEKILDGSFGLGLQPRTAIGQNTDKEVLMLIIDGRDISHSIGATVSDCADILLRYDCWAAMCMDGGSSSSMVYNGEIITKPSTPMENGRYLPNAWLVVNNTKS
ncbi:MAG: phosphodiester glycosidase family protein [Lachnospiraceae bacterium]|nr:phosphodiester glycosidase family protein [Lachnospiraceae bacterium]